VTIAPGQPGIAPAERAACLALSAERDLCLRRILAAWRAGYRAGELARADDYGRGLHDGALARKRAEHGLVELVRLELARWGPGGREHFADPRPDDFPGRGE
jgi:hypothetical protein